MKEETPIPESLKRWLQRHPEIQRAIEAISYEPGYLTPTGWAYDVLLRPGYADEEGFRWIIEPTVRALIRRLKTVEKYEV